MIWIMTPPFIFAYCMSVPQPVRLQIRIVRLRGRVSPLVELDARELGLFTELNAMFTVLASPEPFELVLRISTILIAPAEVVDAVALFNVIRPELVPA